MNIRIFFSSPGDVKMERETAKRIVERLQSEIGERAAIQPYFWEHEVMVATKDYQENIPHMDDFDIVVCILWSRLGTPLDPARHPKPGGGGFKSGTEYEFFTAMQAHDLRGTPDIFVFKNMTEPRRPSRPKEVREAVDREIDRLDSFFESYFEDEKFFTRAINIYSTLGEFEEKLTIALRSYITGRIPVSGAERAGIKKPVYERQPYLGLASFDYEDAPVFFGRTAQVGEIVTVLQNQELEAHTNTDAPPKHFTLILGASGSGKSSLARAGVLPMLTNPGVIEGANSWRTAIFKPADQTGDPILALVNSLDTPHGLPELFADGTKPSELANLIRSQPQGGGLLLRQALTQAGALALANNRKELEEKLDLLVAEHRDEDAAALRERIATLTTPAVRIALLADQLEELFTSDLSPETLNTFIGILVALANSGRVFLIATLRSDFYPRCLDHPELVALMQGSATYALPAPSAADIGQMIRQPAAIAGLSFEEHITSGESLDELLRDAALKDPAALPLLSYTLEQLYEQRTPEGLLTLKAYHDLGGLEGAIGSRAEMIFTNLPSEAQAAFDVLCKQLVTLQEGGEPTRRRAIYSTLTRTPESKTLVDALVAARLLTADQSSSGERVIAVAHEALLKHWPRLVAWVEENRLFLNTRTRVASRMADWIEKNKEEEYLIPRGPNLSAAESILAGHLASLDQLEIEFIGRSAERIRREDQRHLRNARLITAGAVVLCIFAIAGGIIAMFANSAAQKERRTAISEKKNAVVAKAQAIAGETRIAFTKGIELLENGREREGLSALAQTLAIQPDHKGALARIYSEQLYAMPRPLPVFSSTAGVEFRQRLAGAVHGPLQYVIHLTPENKPAVYDIDSGKIIPGPWESSPEAISPLISYDGARVLSITKDMNLRGWDIKTGKEGPACQLDPKFATAWITIDGNYFGEAKPSGDIRIASTVTGQEIETWKVEGDLLGITACGSDYFISSSEQEVRVYDMATKTLSDPIRPPDGYRFLDAVPALPRHAGEDSHRCAVRISTLQDVFPPVQQILFLDAAAGKFDESAKSPFLPSLLSYMPNSEGTAVVVAPRKRNVVIYSTDESIPPVVFPDTISSPMLTISPDGQLVATSSTDGTVDIFDAKSGVRLFSPAHHEAPVNELSITADGRHMLTATNRTATVWNLSTGGGLTMRVSFSGKPAATHLEGDILRIKTDSHISSINVAKMKPSGPNTPLPEGALGTFSDAMIKTAAIYFDEGKIGFYDISGPQPIVRSNWTSPEKEVENWELSDDGTLFAGIAKGKIHLIRTSDASLIATSEIPVTNMLLLKFSPDNKHFAGLFAAPVGSGDLASLHIWNTADLSETPVKIPEVFYSNFAFSPDGRWLSASANGERYNPATNFVLFDLQNPSKPARNFPHPDPVSQMTFNRESNLLGVSGQGGTLRVWNLENMEFIDAPLVEKTNQIDLFTFSEDFNLIATVAIKEGKSSVRVWDWREAAPVSTPWDFDMPVSQIHFSADGRKLIVVAPDEDSDTSNDYYVHIREILPGDEEAKQLLPLAQATVAKVIRQGHTPVPTAPGIIWKTISEEARNAWLLKPAVDRNVSPGIKISTTHWMNMEGLVTGEMTRALPRVAVSHAKMAEWRQDALNHLTAPADETDEAKEARIARRNNLIDTIYESVDFAERNSDGDSETCYRLAQQARGAGENKRSLKYLAKALKIDPKNENSLHLTAVISTDEERHKDATEIYQKLIKLDPENPNYRAKHGLSLIETNDSNTALSELEKIIDDPALEDRLHALALTVMGRHAEAYPYYIKLAEEKRPSPTGPYSTDGLVYLIAANYYAENMNVAVERFQDLIRIEPNAAILENVESAPTNKVLVQALVATLKETLQRHPELIPKEEE